MRILVTGATGFAGSHLVESLLARGDAEVVGIARHVRPAPAWLPRGSPCKMLRCDLCDRAAVQALMEDVRPDAIYHLAGYAHAGESFLDAGAAWAGNLRATRTLYEAVIRWGGSPRIIFVGSGLAYGDPVRADQVFTEEDPFRPVSPYAASKAAADLMSYQYSRAPGLDIVRVRPFNHIGPRQSPSFAIANFARQIVAIENGRQPPVVETGNLGPLRDLTDVRDTVQAYMALAAQGRAGEAYNMASGQVYSMEAVLQRLLVMTAVKAEIRQQSTLVRSTETWAVRASAAKLRKDTGWAPRYSLDEALASTLGYWRTVENQPQRLLAEKLP